MPDDPHPASISDYYYGDHSIDANNDWTSVDDGDVVALYVCCI